MKILTNLTLTKIYVEGKETVYRLGISCQFLGGEKLLNCVIIESL